MNRSLKPRELNGDAGKIIGEVFVRGEQQADPHRELSDLSRSVTVVGKMAEKLSDQYFKPAAKYAGIVAVAGRILWGIVELSVPRRLGFYLYRNWIKVLTALAVLVVILGAISNTEKMIFVGWVLLAGVLALGVLSAMLHRFMANSRW